MFSLLEGLCFSQAGERDGGASVLLRQSDVPSLLAASRCSLLFPSILRKQMNCLDGRSDWLHCPSLRTKDALLELKRHGADYRDW